MITLPRYTTILIKVLHAGSLLTKYGIRSRWQRKQQ
jgi:hypothetical protein